MVFGNTQNLTATIGRGSLNKLTVLYQNSLASMESSGDDDLRGYSCRNIGVEQVILHNDYSKSYSYDAIRTGCCS